MAVFLPLQENHGSPQSAPHVFGGELTVLHVHLLLVVVLIEIKGQNVALIGCDVTGGDVESESYVI